MSNNIDDKVFDMMANKEDELNINTMDETKLPESQFEPIPNTWEYLQQHGTPYFNPQMWMEGNYGKLYDLPNAVNEDKFYELDDGAGVALSDSKKLGQTLRETNKYNFFGQEHYHRPFDEKTEALINSGDKNREDAELNRLYQDLDKRDNPENLSDKERMFAWFGEGNLEWYREVKDLKKTDREAYKEANEELKDFLGEKIQIHQGEYRKNYHVDVEDVYNIYRDRYSSLEEWVESEHGNLEFDEKIF